MATATYPLSNQQLVESINGSAAQGQGFNSIFGLLQGLGYTKPLVTSQLKSAGYSSFPGLEDHDVNRIGADPDPQRDRQ